MKRTTTFLLLFVYVNVPAQECFNEVFPFTNAFKKAKVQKMSVYKSMRDTSASYLMGDYYFHKNGSVFNNVRFTMNSVTRTETFCSCTADSLVRTKKITSYDATGGKIPIEKTVKTYDKKKRLIMLSIESLMGNYYNHIEKFNQKDLTETYIENIVFEGQDSSYHSINKQNSKEFISIIRQKKEGKWNVTKQWVKYKDGLVISFEEFENGKLIHSRKPETNEDAILRKRKDQEGNEQSNALPYNDYIYSDTLTVDVKDLEPFYIRVLDTKYTKKPLKKVIIYNDDLKQFRYQVMLYYANGLPALNHSLALNEFTSYGYSVYP